MFTGLVQAKGIVTAADNGRFAIACPWDPASIALGASICCDGCCLTTTEVLPASGGALFKLDVSNETLSKTTLSHARKGMRVNLEFDVIGKYIERLVTSEKGASVPEPLTAEKLRAWGYNI